MKIRTGSGDTYYDLRDIRESAQAVLAEQLSYSLGQVRCAREKLALLGAMEAALSVQQSIPALNDWQRGWNACKNSVIEAAGVVEDSV